MVSPAITCKAATPAPPPRRRRTSITVEGEKGSTNHLTSVPIARMQHAP
jgi:hypothetical protein